MKTCKKLWISILSVFASFVHYLKHRKRVKSMKETTKYYVVKEKAVPEVLLKVVEAKKLMETGKAITIQEAVDMAMNNKSV